MWFWRRGCVQSSIYLGRVTAIFKEWKWQPLSHVWLFATPWTVSRQDPLSMGFPRQLAWVAMPFSRGSSPPRDQTWVSPHCRQILYHLSHPGSLQYIMGGSLYLQMKKWFYTSSTSCTTILSQSMHVLRSSISLRIRNGSRVTSLKSQLVSWKCFWKQLNLLFSCASN